GAELARKRQPFRPDVDSNNWTGANDPRRHDCREANGSGSENSKGLAGLDAKRIDHSAGSGLQAATERRQESERQGSAHLHDVPLSRQDMRREGRLAKKVPADMSRGISAASV